MKLSHWMTALALVCISFASGAIGSWAYAQLAAEPPFTTFMYRGYLEGDMGPLNATVTLRLGLFDSRTGGTELAGSPWTVENVAVTNGHFSAPLSISESTLESPEVWLAISVDAGSGFVPMDDRQRVTSLPYAAIAHSATQATGVLRAELDGLVQRSGDTFSGDVGMSGSLRVDGALTVNGQLSASVALQSVSEHFCVFRNGGSCPSGFIDDEIALELGTHGHDMCPGDEVAGDSTFSGGGYCSVRIRMCCK